MKRLFVLLTVFCFVYVSGHEFWLAPQRFFYRVRENANIRFMVGENFAGQNWGGNSDKVHTLQHFLPTGEVVSIAGLLSANKGDSLSLALPQAGTHMVAFYSTNSFIQLGAAQFTTYLNEDGLTGALTYRKQHGEDSMPGREYYCRSVKTIFQVSDLITDACTQPTDLPLDIIPEDNPYTVPADLVKQGVIKTRFRILFRGKPVANKLVKVWYYSKEKKLTTTDLTSNRNGWIVAERKPGLYMVSCVHMERNTTDTVAQWQSYWGSLSFEYPQFFPGPATR